jgi:hypothetical protein
MNVGAMTASFRRPFRESLEAAAAFLRKQLGQLGAGTSGRFPSAPIFVAMPFCDFRVFCG